MEKKGDDWSGNNGLSNPCSPAHTHRCVSVMPYEGDTDISHSGCGGRGKKTSGMEVFPTNTIFV